MATNIDGILEATRVGQQVLDGVMRLVPAGEKLYQLQCRQRTHGTPDIYGRMIQHTCKCFVEVADGNN